MKITTFNIQNIFHRDTHLVKKYAGENMEAWTEEFENLMCKYRPCEKDYSRMRDLSVLLGFHKPSYEPYLSMRRKSGQLHVQKGKFLREYKASHLTDWNGWIKLNTIPINEIAIQNKANVINDVDPDILLLQEVEDRATLVEFNNEFLSNDDDTAKFQQIIYLETNDSYGRGMGVLTKKGYQVKSIKTHVNDLDKNGNSLFDLDLQEYEIKTPSGESIQLLATHLIEGSVDSEESNSKRKIQSQKIAEVYKNLQETNNLIAVIGTLNAPCYSDSISPLLKETDLKDVTRHTSFTIDSNNDKNLNSLYITTHKMGVNTKQRDYLLFSPKFFKSVKNSGLYRKGIWHKKQPHWDMYRSIQKEIHAASQHPLIWSKF
ncbi:MAG: hypothetical protein L3J20_01895 [Flavobacteriaceae bacterium]|nr:hypothetical protein [Flavobacteriaceae bacterium]